MYRLRDPFEVIREVLVVDVTVFPPWRNMKSAFSKGPFSGGAKQRNRRLKLLLRPNKHRRKVVCEVEVPSWWSSDMKLRTEVHVDYHPHASSVAGFIKTVAVHHNVDEFVATCELDIIFKSWPNKVSLINYYVRGKGKGKGRKIRSVEPWEEEEIVVSQEVLQSEAW